MGRVVRKIHQECCYCVACLVETELLLDCSQSCPLEGPPVLSRSGMPGTEQR